MMTKDLSLEGTCPVLQGPVPNVGLSTYHSPLRCKGHVPSRACPIVAYSTSRIRSIHSFCTLGRSHSCRQKHKIEALSKLSALSRSIVRDFDLLLASVIRHSRDRSGFEVVSDKGLFELSSLSFTLLIRK